MNIKIQNAWGEHGETMKIYRNNELVSKAVIDGSNEPPETLLDYLIEFSLRPSEIGIEACANLDNEPNFENNGTVVWILK